MSKTLLFYIIYFYLLKNIIKIFYQYDINNIINDNILFMTAFVIIIYNLVTDILSSLYLIISYFFLNKKNKPIIKKYFLRDRTLIKKPDRLLF